ncbi:uncharacterized protein LOC131635394 [Vicia villosa]|uniref:uncharacterized protein LOC131635394 n=1 Tax=Vicia villosa TaxID=3911 RepID=UPI00273B8352|nr:uncharacterized protein LOC131635394 [Vicia villosa]
MADLNIFARLFERDMQLRIVRLNLQPSVQQWESVRCILDRSQQPMKSKAILHCQRIHQHILKNQENRMMIEVTIKVETKKIVMKIWKKLVMIMKMWKKVVLKMWKKVVPKMVEKIKKNSCVLYYLASYVLELFWLFWDDSERETCV